MAIAQAIPIVFSPVLTRLSTPEEVGYFATNPAISSFFTVIMSGKCELAIILPKRDEEATNFLSSSALLSFVINTASCIFCFTSPDHLQICLG